MKYLLDTNICIYCISRKPPSVIARVNRESSSDIAISSITLGELLSGSARSMRPLASRIDQLTFFTAFHSLPFDDAAATVYGMIDGYLKNRGIAIGPLDTQIAAIAMAHSLTVVTHNTKHFSRIPELQIEDWAIAQANHP